MKCECWICSVESEDSHLQRRQSGVTNWTSSLSVRLTLIVIRFLIRIFHKFLSTKTLKYLTGLRSRILTFLQVDFPAKIFLSPAEGRV